MKANSTHMRKWGKKIKYNKTGMENVKECIQREQNETQNRKRNEKGLLKLESVPWN